MCERVDGKCLKWKWELNSFSASKALFYGQTENIFSLTQFNGPTKYAIFRKMISKFHLKSKQTDPKDEREEIEKSYQMNINHYLYSNDYDPSIGTYSFKA